MADSSLQFWLGDEAIAMGAVHGGIAAAYGYPGTPSTEILEFLIGYSNAKGGPISSWCTNEKTAYETALGVSLAGKRSLVTMKHVGLNVAADPFMNSAMIDIHGGLVLAVADDPGMHSSQNEQDSRFFADFAKTICLEPSDQQQAYDMTREAFELSERFKLPVMLRFPTRLAHSRATVRPAPAKTADRGAKANNPAGWVLVPGNARKQFGKLLDRQPEMILWSETSSFNSLELAPKRGGLGVITSGIARNYFNENRVDLGREISWLHIGAYPLPVARIRELLAHVDEVLILEEGYPLIERQLRGLLGTNAIPIRGKLSGEVPRQGELNPDIVRAALKLRPHELKVSSSGPLPGRPPQLCAGCPHADTYDAMKAALKDFPRAIVTADIGCYTLGALAPYNAVETCVCMGASVGMARGASDAGFHPVVGVIGDSTFLHSGMAPLVDAVAANTNMTLIIVDNEATAMTGGQKTILSSSRLEQVVRGIGISPEHLVILEAHRKNHEENTRRIRQELEYKGLSVIIAIRECIETAKKKKKGAAQ